MSEAGFTCILSKSLMNTRTKTELMPSGVGSVFILRTRTLRGRTRNGTKTPPLFLNGLRSGVYYTL